MPTSRRTVLAGLGSLPFLARPAVAGRCTPTLDRFLQQQVQSGRVVGIAARVERRDGDILYQGTAGRRDPDSADPIRPDTLFRLASMTKPITAVAVLMLIEAGRLHWNDPLSRFLPEFAETRVQVRPGQTEPMLRPPTIRDLLCHISGLSYRFMNVPGVVQAYQRLGVDDGLAAPELSLRTNMRRLAHAPLQAQPGTHWGYGLSFDALGAVVQRVAGQPLDGFVRDHIAGPLGLPSLGFHVPADQRRLMARVMRLDGGRLRPIRNGDAVLFPATGGYVLCDPDRAFAPTAYPSGGGGAVSTLGDFSRFARMLLKGGALDGVLLLRPDTVAAMSSPQTGALPIDLAGPGYAFGYGVAVLTDPAAAKSPKPRGTYGWSGVYGTGFSIDPVNGLVATVMTGTAIDGMAIADAFVHAFYEAGIC